MSIIYDMYQCKVSYGKKRKNVLFIKIVFDVVDRKFYFNGFYWCFLYIGFMVIYKKKYQERKKWL